MSVEKRYAAELRVGSALGGNDGGEEMSLVGYAARFNSPSKDLGGFKETIAPGAFTRALAANSDVRCLFNHDANKVLGRTLSGTLKLEQDETGLKFRCMLDPNNTEHRNLHSSVKRGDINECSFAFTPNGDGGDEWADKKDEQGKYFISRTLKDVNLFDVSAVTHPAYSNTSVAARAEAITPEIRSIMSEIVKKRTAKIGGIEARDESVQDMLNCLSKCLAAQFPREDNIDGSPYVYGKYWMLDTFDGYIIACNEGPGAGADFVSISYVAKPDGDGFVFGTPMPVEKEWVPSDRHIKSLAEFRALTSTHMQAIADQHKQEAAAHADIATEHGKAAAEHTDTAAAHTKAAADAQKESDRMEKCSATKGDCGIKSCSCQNQMVAERDMEDDDFDYEDLTPEEIKALVEENRDAAAQVVTKKVGGKSMRACAFRTVGNAKDTSTWSGIRAKRAKVAPIVADSAVATAAARAAEIEDLELRFRLAMTRP